MLICAFPTFSGDVSKLIDLLEWINQLGSCEPHKALIVADFDTPFDAVNKAKKIAQKAFSEVFVISTKESVKGWIPGANSLFWKALEFSEKVNLPMFFCEPDAIPLKTGWLQTLDDEFTSKKTKYLGAFYDSNAANLPKRLMSGVAVYFPGAFKELPKVPQSPRSFDCDFADIFVKEGSDTTLIKSLWGMPLDPPRFSGKAVPGTSMFSLESIPKEAVVWHRCKDGSLIRQLRKAMGISDPLKSGGFVTVFPFFQKDAHLTLKGLQWMAQLDCCRKYDALLSFEHGVATCVVEEITRAARMAFKEVFILEYPKAPIPGWPSGPNWAFQHTANCMQNMNRPWLFFESDMWAITKDWLDKLQEEYASCGKAFMGHIVKDFGHLQGTSIYPADLPIRCPKVMAATDVAFDTVSKNEMLADCHAANEFFGHVWGLHGGTPHHYTGTPIHFATADQVRAWIPKSAVTFHRCKDSSLVDRLREMKGV